MDLIEFRKDLIESIRSSAEVNKDFVRSCYVDDAGTRLMDAEEISDFQSCHYEGFGTRKRRIQVDGYSFDDADGSLTLLIAEFSNDYDLQTFGATDARRLFGNVQSYLEEVLAGNLTNGSIDESQPGFGLASDIIRLQSSIVRFRLYLVSNDQYNSKVDEWPEIAINGIPVEYHIWDIARFHKAHESANGRDDLEVNFRTSACAGLSALEAGSAEGQYNAYLCTITGQSLAEIYERYGSRLLEGNVRSFLSVKGKINSGIQATILNEPEMFFAYNNGIAATADSVILDNTEGLKITNAVNFQIVNGGQTTASLAIAARSGMDLSKVCVQMKLSVLPAQRSGELIPLIARYANSQNKVNNADFFANHPYHIRIEELSRRIWAPAIQGSQSETHWFYERARGQYLNEQSRLRGAPKAKFLVQNPKSQMLTKTDVAKLENTWRGFPQKVSLGAQKNFLIFAEWAAKKWTEDDKRFNEEYFQNLIAVAILFRHTEKLVKNQTWYQGGYRANIVTYSLALLQIVILKNANGRQLNLREIWTTQSVPYGVSEQISAIAKAVFHVLTAPNRPKDNVTEWAKMDTCWAKAMEVQMPLNKDIYSHLIDPLLKRSENSESESSRLNGYGIYAKTTVMNAHVPHWEKMRLWGIEQGILSGRESDLLRAASRIPQFLPSARDCEKILSIRSKLVDKGFELESN